MVDRLCQVEPEIRPENHRVVQTRRYQYCPFYNSYNSLDSRLLPRSSSANDQERDPKCVRWHVHARPVSVIGILSLSS
jgi:hypothetical protein